MIYTLQKCLLIHYIFFLTTRLQINENKSE